MRNMSFMLTTQQMRDETKDVTRRLGWSFLKAGDLVMACVKCQGLGKGGKIERIHPIKIVSVENESLMDIEDRSLRAGSDRTEMEREGFPNMSGPDFIAMFSREMKCHADEFVNRIEFLHISTGGTEND